MKKKTEPGDRARRRCQFTAVVTARREELGLTWREMAAKAGLNTGSISRALTANGNVNVGTIEAIADALGLSPNAFWSGHER